MKDILCLQGKKVLITGANGYLGQVLVRMFQEQGCTVAAVGRQEQFRGPEKGVHYVKCDLNDISAIKPAVDKAAADMGGLDIFVHSAASADLFFAEDMPTEEWNRTIHASLNAGFHFAQASFPYLKQSKGAIVSVASISGIIGLPRGTTHHSAAKAGLLGMTRSLAVEWAKYGIRVNAVVPGQFDTGPLRKVMENEQSARDILKNIPLGRVGTSEEVANAIMFLASNAASGFITGHSLVIDGGTTIQ